MWWMTGILASAAEPTVKIEGQVRPRLESHTGRDGAPGGGQTFVTQRARLGATLSLEERLSVRIVVQDVRNWGEETNTLFDFSADGLDVHFGYFDYRPTSEVRLRVGRQPFGLHEERLIGAVEWTSQGRVFDGANLLVERGAFDLEVAGALVGIPNDERDDVAALGYLRTGVSGDGYVADLLYVVDGNGDRILHTVGGYAKGGTVLLGRAEAYLQTSSAGVAGMVGVAGTFRPEVAGSPWITLWADLLTGTNGNGATFDTLYATNHKFYGRADIAVFRQGGMADGRGLTDLAMKLGAKPSDRLALRLDGHVFRAGLGASQPGERVGEEVDAWAMLTVLKHFKVSAGGAVFLSPAEPDVWGYLMLDAFL